ncbi:MAG TPA: hypothetical protein VE153_28645 [Myxococcus sp.]|nr:hypothetical protein [Myxococcus sp.]
MATQLWMSALLLAGCASGGTMTLVEGSLKPQHFQFVTVVPRTERGADGWRAACVHVPISRMTGESYLCRLGVEMPLENEADGPVSTELAQKIAADCANVAARNAFESVTPATPLVLACQGFKNVYDATLRSAFGGSRVGLRCHHKTTPIQVVP